MSASRRHDPVAVVAAAIDAFQREDWDEVAALCHPASLGAFKAQQLRQFNPGRPVRRISVDELLRFVPDMPRAVAEYNVAERERMAREMEDVTRQYDGIDSVEQLRELPPAQVYAAWLRAHSPRREVERAMRERQLPAEAFADSVALAREQFRLVIVGAIADGENVAHVIYRDAPRGDGGEEADDSSPDVAAWRAQETADEREVRALVGDSHAPRLAMCLRLPGDRWALVADHLPFGLGSFGFGAGFMASASGDAEEGA